MDMFKKKKSSSPSREWSRSGNFMNKPDNGWIHPDEQLSRDAGICYGIRYIGCLRIKESMKNLDFDTRTCLAREAIRLVAEAAGLKIVDKRRKLDRRISRMLGDMPSMEHAGANVNLTITTAGLNLMIMESGEVIADHAMPGISFASGGDSDTMDFVAYVAKDAVNGRACHVFECGGGLAEDVITTVGQAFELRFKEFLQKQPKAVNLPNRSEMMGFDTNSSAWGDDSDDRIPVPDQPAPPIPTYATPSSNARVPQAQLSSPTDRPLIDFSDPDPFSRHTNSQSKTDEDSKRDAFNMDEFDAVIKTINREIQSPLSSPSNAGAASGPTHAQTSKNTGNKGVVHLEDEVWYHGPLTRKQADVLVTNDGDFLVRESTTTPGQYVLTGRQNSCPRHLLLVDPNGVVRTKDHAFENVSHLINYHRDNDLPIVSQDSELRLLTSVSKLTNKSIT